MAEGDDERKENVVGVLLRILLRARILLESLIFGASSATGFDIPTPPRDCDLGLSGVPGLRRKMFCPWL